MDALVSIIMPSYNTGHYIAESIQSVLCQSYSNWELIIVDDCSQDNTDDVVSLFLNDQRIKYFKNEQNSGAAVSRNKALREAKGRWIAFLDSDDLWMPDKLTKQIIFMEKNNFHFSYTNYAEIDTEGKRTKVYEYMSLGMPVILSRSNYNQKMMDKYHFGICVDPDDIEETAKAMSFIFDNPDIAKEMGKNGRNAVRDVFNWETESKKLTALYHKILSL